MAVIRKFTWLACLLFVIGACGNGADVHESQQETRLSATSPSKSTPDSTLFLWREPVYDTEIDDSIEVIRINEHYARSATEAEVAAIAYAATFTGNACWWDGDSPDSGRSNLKCAILEALQLGYQCSETHLGIIRKWLGHLPRIMTEIANCPTIPYTATIQDTFDEIVISRTGNRIELNCKGRWINVREDRVEPFEKRYRFNIDGERLQPVTATLN